MLQRIGDILKSTFYWLTMKIVENFMQDFSVFLIKIAENCLLVLYKIFDDFADIVKLAYCSPQS